MPGPQPVDCIPLPVRNAGRGLDPSAAARGLAALQFPASICHPAGRRERRPPTNYQKAATNNKNHEPSNCRVLAPGRGQSVRSWILKGALAKRSRKARTQAPLSRASRAIGSSGTLFGSFWGSKRNTYRAEAHYKSPCRKVGRGGTPPVSIGHAHSKIKRGHPYGNKTKQLLSAIPAGR